MIILWPFIFCGFYSHLFQGDKTLRYLKILKQLKNLSGLPSSDKSRLDHGGSSFKEKPNSKIVLEKDLKRIEDIERSLLNEMSKNRTILK